MQLHTLQPTYRLKGKRRVGRGGKRGTYSGRGMKGQRARSGAKLRPALRDFIKRIPKLRGVKMSSARPVFIQVVNIGMLNNRFSDGEKVTPQVLLEKKVIRRIKGNAPDVKILGDGALSKRIIIEGCMVSEGARTKIEKSGGVVK